jgi:hypothetical protein
LPAPSMPSRVMKQAMSFSLSCPEYSGALRGCVLPG